MTINEFLSIYKVRVKPKIVCADGFTISVQASSFHYCSPRTDSGPWGMVECGYPSAHPGEDFVEYAEDMDNPLETVYGYVPIDVVQDLIDKHGGIAK